MKRRGRKMGEGERNMRKEWGGIKQENTCSNYFSKTAFSTEEKDKLPRLVKARKEEDCLCSIHAHASYIMPVIVQNTFVVQSNAAVL